MENCCKTDYDMMSVQIEKRNVSLIEDMKVSVDKMLNEFKSKDEEMRV